MSEQSDSTETGPRGQPSSPRLWSASDTPAILGGLGVAAVGIANNHQGDLGAAGREATLAGLRAAGLVAVGGDAGVGILDRGGLRIALTAHALGEAESIDDESFTKFIKSVREELVAARRGVDHLLATFHIDGPPSYLPPPGLRRAAELAVDAGAVAVIAHGSHAIAGVERRGRALIAWGLGNLAFACRCTDEVDAAILTLTLDHQGLAAAAWIPIAAGLHGRPLAAHPDPALLFDLLKAVSRGRAPGRVGEGRYHLELAGAPAKSEGSP